MKKLTSLLLIVMLLLSFVSCNVTPEESKRNESKSSNSSSPSTTATKEPEKVLPEKPEDPRAEPMKALEYYIAAKEDAEVKALKDSADEVISILGYNYDLSLSHIIVYGFLKENDITDMFIMNIKDGDFKKAADIHDKTPNGFANEYAVDTEGILESLKAYYENEHRQFNIYGIFTVSYFNSLQNIIFGKAEEQGPLMTAAGKSFVEYYPIERDIYSFEDLEVAKKEYREHKAEIIEAIPVYSWSDRENERGDGWHGWTPYPPYLSDIVTCPVESGENGVRYLHHILFYKNKIIGEELLKKTEGVEGYETLVSNYGEYNEETHLYAPLENSLYLKAIEDFKTANPGTEIKGVSFDGENFHVIPVE